MTEICEWLAFFSFFTAFVLAAFTSSRHWVTFIALGLAAWMFHLALVSSHVIK